MKTIKTLTLLIAILIAYNIYAQSVTLDPTFGQNGVTVIPDAKMGITFAFDQFGNIFIGVTTADYRVVIIKMNADGIIDENFGTNGQILVSEDPITWPPAELRITNENKILLCETFNGSNINVILRRFNEDGSIDQTFGNQGIMNLSALIGAYNPILIRAVNLENDDFMLIGVTEHITAGKSYILKYYYDGVLDESFGENGKVYLTDNDETFNIHPRAIKILNDHSIIVAGFDNVGLSSGGRLAFCKLSPTGNLVADFAHNGIWVMDNNLQQTEHFYSIIEDKYNGNLVFARERYVSWEAYYFVCSFYPDGTLNSGFGTNGCYTNYNVFEFSGEIQTLQSGSKYLLKYDDLITSINNIGTLDTNFNHTGVFSLAGYRFKEMKLQDTNKLVLLGHFYDSDIVAIIRLNIPYESVSIKETPDTESRVNIFPNPTTGELTINASTSSAANEQLVINSVEIFDVYGRKHEGTKARKHEREILIDIAHLPVGIYFVKIKTEAGTQTQKVIKY